MAEYQQKENTGNVFQPLPDQSLILTGKLDVDGTVKHVNLMKDTTADNKPVVFIYERIGYLMKDDDANDDNKRPHYKGKFTDETKEISAWKKISQKGNNYLNCVLQEPYQKPNSFQDNDIKKEIEEPLDEVGDVPF